MFSDVFISTVVKNETDNYINITVTAENGSTNVYSLIVVKEKSSNNMNIH